MGNINRIYIHVPFCSSKCGYCAFHSIPGPSEDIVTLYLEKLEKGFEKGREKTGALESVFIGGGTPGFLSPSNLEKLFNLIRKNFSISEKTEISIECNPESLTDAKIELIENFANRVSMGIQSFNERHRKTLGRAGSLKEVYGAIGSLGESKINNISCDIIYGIPGQTLKDFENDILSIINNNIFKHFSAYALTLEEDSKIYNVYSEKGKAKLEDISSEMWEFLPAAIKCAGFKRYEISNYSLPGMECKHNVDAWFGGKYLGFGPAASSFDGKIRWTQGALYDWAKGGSASYDEISEDERMNEIFMMGLRTVFGWELEPEKKNSFRISGPYKNNSFLVPVSYVEGLKKKLLDLKESGLLRLEEKKSAFRVFPTNKGLSFWNEIALRLV